MNKLALTGIHWNVSMARWHKMAMQFPIHEIELFSVPVFSMNKETGVYTTKDVTGCCWSHYDEPANEISYAEHVGVEEYCDDYAPILSPSSIKGRDARFLNIV